MCHESSILISELVKCPARFLYVSFFRFIRIMSRMSTALHLHVVCDDIIRQLTNGNTSYKFSACTYIVAGVCN